MKIKFGRSWGRHLRQNKAYNRSFLLKRKRYKAKWNNPKTWSEMGINYHSNDRSYY